MTETLILEIYFSRVILSQRRKQSKTKYNSKTVTSTFYMWYLNCIEVCAHRHRAMCHGPLSALYTHTGLSTSLNPSQTTGFILLLIFNYKSVLILVLGLKNWRFTWTYSVDPPHHFLPESSILSTQTQTFSK